MTQDKATPRPWTKEEDKVSKALWIQAGINGDVCDLYNQVNGKCFRYENAEANAEIIVNAVNSHKALVQACKIALAESQRADLHFKSVSPATRALEEALKQAGEL